MEGKKVDKAEAQVVREYVGSVELWIRMQEHNLREIKNEITDANWRIQHLCQKRKMLLIELAHDIKRLNMVSKNLERYRNLHKDQLNG